jgi:uncharacterized phage-like protein YoqJ
MRIVTVTGHRPKYLKDGYSQATFNTLVDIAETWLSTEKPDSLISGAALGWDLACVQACLNLDILFVAAVPFRNQDAKWLPKQQLAYREQLTKAKEVVYVDELTDPQYLVKNSKPGLYNPYKLLLRNNWMIDQCTEVLALWNNKCEGGTYQAVKYAESKGLTVTNLWGEYELNS